jgi:hypothetical protein
MALVRVMPGQPHWDMLSENEPEGQSCVSVYACWDCRHDFSLDYFGLPPEMLGERPQAPAGKFCRLCKLPFRPGEWPPLLRLWKDDPRYERFARNEPPEQTSVSIYICGDCRAAEVPAYLERTGLKAADHHLV